MDSVDQDLIDYLIAEAPDLEASDWIKSAVFNYENLVRCHQCNGERVAIIADTKVVIKCKDCNCFSSENISFDKIPSINYNDVQFLQEKKIIEILEAQGKI